MCLIAFAWQVHAEYPLIVAANRDEFFARPTASADWWDDGELLGGRDLRAGGTWMGVSRNGRFAALTNYRDPASQRSDAPSRGELVSQALRGQVAILAGLEWIGAAAARYNGFNLLAAQWHTDPARAAMWIVSSRGDAHPHAIEPGIHALSNAALDTPWPKVERARDSMQSAMQSAMQDATQNAMDRAVKGASGRDELCAALFALLGDSRVADEDELPRTGVAPEVERALSAAFIRMPGYGTRSSTLFLVGREGDALFIERRCEPESPIEERRFDFRIARA